MLDHIPSIAGATDLPLSADLGNGFATQPEQVAHTVRLAAEAGAVGGSIEDASDDEADPMYEETLAVERIQAACCAARELPFPFTLTARCEEFLVGGRDLDKAIRRLQAYEQARADVLYAPGLKTHVEIAAVVSAESCPVNVLMGLPGCTLDLVQLCSLGVRRISAGSALSRIAFGAFFRAAMEMRYHGIFRFAEETISLGLRKQRTAR